MKDQVNSNDPLTVVQPFKFVEWEASEILNTNEPNWSF